MPDSHSLLVIRDADRRWDTALALLAAMPNVQLVAVAAKAGEAMQALDRLPEPPEAVLAAGAVQGADATAFHRALRARCPRSSIAVFTPVYEASIDALRRALRIGSYLTWDELNEERLPLVLSALAAGIAAQTPAVSAATPIATPTARLLRVLLADANAMDRRGLAGLLAGDPRFTVVAETAGDTIALARRLRPDLIVLDPAAEGTLAIDVIEELSAALPETGMCVLHPRV